MTAKILVADDSLTIQKVIGITLASSGYELVECLNETDLFRFLQSKDFDLVLLDFNLSDKRTGYELSRQIKELCPDLPIMIMLGTFDSVEESQLVPCGISDRVVKPFESGKFIKKCKDLIENATNLAKPVTEEQVSDQAEVRNEDDFSFGDKLDSWVVDAPVIQKESRTEIDIVHTPLKLDPLESELAGWSIDEGVNLEEKYNKTFPPIIENAHEVNVLERFQEASDFLDRKEKELEEQVDEKFDHEFSNITQPTFEIPLDLNQQLISEINDDFTPDAFWAVDDIVTIESEDSKQIKETHLDLVQNKAASSEKISISPEVREIPLLNHDEIIEKLKISLRPIIEDMVKEFCRQSAEKIAWEVIPDLAENLIRKELKEISDSL
jgi:DNA-binding response OmpR family regulator